MVDFWLVRICWSSSSSSWEECFHKSEWSVKFVCVHPRIMPFLTLHFFNIIITIVNTTIVIINIIAIILIIITTIIIILLLWSKRAGGWEWGARALSHVCAGLIIHSDSLGHLRHHHHFHHRFHHRRHYRGSCPGCCHCIFKFCTKNNQQKLVKIKSAERKTAPENGFQ